MSRPREDETTRFWSKVNKTGDCWLWISAKDIKGYGLFQISQPRATPRAHRWAYAQSIGVDIRNLEAEVVRHTCDNPGCVNPSHLCSGTVQDNVDDKMRRGRHVAGRTCKLTETQVVNIRRSLELGQTHDHIAKRHGVARTTVTMIHTGKNWRQRQTTQGIKT